MQAFEELARARKSVRTFTAEPVSDQDILRVLDIAVCAPTNCNQQLWSFVVVRSPETKERLIREAACNTLIGRSPVVVFVTYDGWNRKEALQGASLAAGHILLAAQYFGLGGCAMNSYGSDRRVRKILGIPESEVVCCAVILGHPDGNAAAAAPVPRRPVHEVVGWEGFGGRRRPPFTYDPEDWTIEDLAEHQRYYCRKTFAGKEMDIMSRGERELVRRQLAELRGLTVDLFSYDGAYLREFPTSDRSGGIVTLDLTAETRAYSEAAVRLTVPDSREAFEHRVYSPESSDLGVDGVADISLVFKLERLSRVVRSRVLEQAYGSLPEGGRLVVISRTRNVLFSAFYSVIRRIFGDDVRRTGIYTFFGPYRPLPLRATLQELRSVGFKVSCSTYFPFPSFYDQVYQMFLQYLKSDGSSYLHRRRREDLISRTISAINRAQGFRTAAAMGSVATLRCVK